MMKITRTREEPQAYSVAAFCKSHSISRSFFYDLKNRGLAPRMFKAGNRTLISREAAHEWRNKQSNAQNDLP